MPPDVKNHGADCCETAFQHKVFEACARTSDSRLNISSRSVSTCGEPGSALKSHTVNQMRACACLGALLRSVDANERELDGAEFRWLRNHKRVREALR